MYLAQQPGAADKEDAGTRTFGEIRGNRDRRRRQAADIALACRCGAAPPDGEDPTGAAGVVHGSSPVDYRPDRTGVPRSVERRRTVPPGEEGWRGALGTVASVGGWVHTATHFCNGTRTDAGESGEDRDRNRRLRPRDDGGSRRDPRNTGAYDDGRAWASRDGDDCAGADHLTAPGC